MKMSSRYVLFAPLTALAIAGLSSAASAAPGKKGKTTQPVVQTSGGINASYPAPASKATLPANTKIKATIRAPGSLVRSPRLSKMERRDLQNTKPLPAGARDKILHGAGIKQFGAVSGPISLTVRRPYAGSAAFMSFINAATTNPAEGAKGTASIVSNPLATTSDGFAIDPSALPFGQLGPIPLAEPPRGAVVVDFRAKADTHYLVQCTWRAKERPPSEVLPAGYVWEPVRQGDFRSVVADPANDAVVPLTTTDKLVVQLIPAASQQRRVQVRVMAGVGWLTSECSITPVGA